MIRITKIFLLGIITLLSTMGFAQEPSYNESFEDGVIPDTWTILDENGDFRMWEADSRESNTGMWSAGVSANSDGKKDDWLITPKLLPAEEHHTFSFFARSQVPMPFLLEDFEVRLSTTGLNAEDFDVLLGQETEVPAEWTQYTYDLSEYIDEEVYVALRNNSIDKTVLFADDFHAPFFFYSHDLRVNELTGETMPLIGEEQTYEIAVENTGWESQPNYEVVLYSQDDEVLASVEGPAVDPFQEIIIPISWTPASEETTAIYAKIEADNDENLENNTSDNWYISVHNNQLLTVTHGEFDGYEFSPIFYPAKTSLSESVYLAEDINMMGYLSEIAYSANFEYEIRDKNIRIWIGETGMEALDMKWIPSSKLTMVYDEQVTIPKGEWVIPITFDQEYQYKGGNLVVLIERSWDNRAYAQSNTFHATPTEGMRTIQYENNFETTDPANPSLNPYWTKSSPHTPDVHLFFKDMENMGSLSGVVTDNNSNPVEGVKIEAEELNYITYSQPDGSYEIPYIYSGTYNFSATKHGYFTEQVQVDIAESQNQEQDFTLTPIPEVTVEGRVTGSDDPDTGIEGATVKFDGYEEYTTTTDDAGYFSFESVYTGNVYLMSIEADGYMPYQMDVAVDDAPLNLGTITINEVTPPPVQVTASDFDMMAGVSWIEPNGLPSREFRYDDGEIISQIGLEGAFPHAVMGSVHHSNSIVTSISWYLTDEAEHDSVKLIVLGLDLMGKPDDSNILFESGMVPNTDNQWNEYVLPAYIDAPDGFFVGINTPNQFTSLGVDDGMEEPYEFSFGTHYVVDDWTAGNEWVDLGELGVMENLMIRAEGYSFGFKAPAEKGLKRTGRELALKKTPADITTNNSKPFVTPKEDKSLESYQVFRLLHGEEQNQENWTTLSENFSGTFYEDFEWASLPPATYRYAVIAEYTNGLFSNPRFSNTLVKEEKVDVNISVTTNSDDPVDGANISFESVQGFSGYNYNGVLDETGEVNLTDIPKDTYIVYITLEGFGEAYDDNIVIASDTTLSFELSEQLIAPFNPIIEPDEEGSAIFTWNNKPDSVTEDFEASEDFSHDLGEWTTVDGDRQQTLYMNEFDYPLNGDTMGFVVFNPQATDPPMLLVSAYSGERCAAAVNADMAESDDWLISPEIEEVVEGSVFRFMARSSNDRMELEWFRVGVSTTGTNPEDFTIISEGEFMVAPFWDWQEFSFDLSDFAGQQIYVAIQHISVDGYMLLIDDLFVGMPEKSDRSFIDYTVYLDDQVVESTGSERFTFNNLADGQEYVAGVQSNYATGESDMVTVNFTANNLTSADEISVDVMKVYPNPSDGPFYISANTARTMHITVFNASGQTVIDTVKQGPKAKLQITESGVYWIRVVVEDHVYTKKLVVS